MNERIEAVLGASGLRGPALAALSGPPGLFALTGEALLYQGPHGTRRVNLRDLTRIHSDQEGVLRVETPAGVALSASLIGFEPPEVQDFFRQVRDVTAQVKDLSPPPMQGAPAQPGPTGSVGGGAAGNGGGAVTSSPSPAPEGTAAGSGLPGASRPAPASQVPTSQAAGSQAAAPAGREAAPPVVLTSGPQFQQDPDRAGPGSDSADGKGADSEGANEPGPVKITAVRRPAEPEPPPQPAPRITVNRRGKREEIGKEAPGKDGLSRFGGGLMATLLDRPQREPVPPEAPDLAAGLPAPGSVEIRAVRRPEPAPPAPAQPPLRAPSLRLEPPRAASAPSLAPPTAASPTVLSTPAPAPDTETVRITAVRGPSAHEPLLPELGPDDKREAGDDAAFGGSEDDAHSGLESLPSSSLPETALAPGAGLTVTDLYGQADKVGGLVTRLRILAGVLAVAAAILAVLMVVVGQPLTAAWVVVLAGVGALTLLSLADMARLQVVQAYLIARSQENAAGAAEADPLEDSEGLEDAESAHESSGESGADLGAEGPGAGNALPGDRRG